MKKISLIAALASLAMLAACGPKTATVDYTAYVNPFIGTGGHGHTYPGAVVPHGMIQLSPDTRIHGWDACSGYYWDDGTINGFSHTHLNGTGCGDLGDVLIMPTVGEQDIRPVGPEDQQLPWCSTFSHENETATPGYYSVTLDRYGVGAELTATSRVGLHRYTFPKSDDAGFILDFDYSLQEQRNEDMWIEVISDTEIVGHRKSVYWAFDHYTNFYAKFSKPFTYTLVSTPPEDLKEPHGPKGPHGDRPQALSQNAWRPGPPCKVLLHFATEEGEQVLVKVGVSAVDVDGARRNVEAEVPDWDFDGVREAAATAWNDYLSKIDIRTADEDQRAMFYTALYHTGVQPNLFTDVDGRYLGMDLKIHQGSVDDPVYTVFSIWDTFRAYHPLMTIIDPEFNEALLRSLVLKAGEGGMVPMWELCGNYTGTMIGYHAASLFADSYVKGYRNFDIEAAYRACIRAAEYDPKGIVTNPAVIPQLMPQAKYWKNKIGYVACDKDIEAVAKGLEYAYDDWCISMLADSLGDEANHAKYAQFAKAYQRYFDPKTRFMRGLDSRGRWRTPFNPTSSNHRNDDYCEGNAWQWTWFVPHDVDGLVELFGGREGFIAKLDSLFTVDSALEGDNVSADISGLIGQYAHGNEPSHHITHLYNYVGEPWRTQELVDEVLHTLYFNDPDGLSGNEDCGQMSAWFILNAIGFYQVCPGKPVYSIGRPLFDEVSISLPGGGTFKVIAHNNSRENKYVQSIALNGTPLDSPFFSHSDIVDGGVLELTMGPERPEND